MVVYLGEVDARGLYREQAYSALIWFAVEELHLSESQAYLRIHAARVARKYPMVIGLLAEGAVNLSTIKTIAPLLNADNHRQLLERVRGMKKRAVEKLTETGQLTLETTSKSIAAGSSSVEDTLERQANSHRRYIPRAVVREVYARDAGQCSFVSSNGRRCMGRGALELHHVFPYARGGSATVENLRLACRAHNALYAEQDFGAEFVRAKRSPLEQGHGAATESGH